QGNEVSITGWLKVEKANTSARTGRNPQTGEEIQVPAGTRTKVTAGSKLKAAGKS
ncbi:MAG: HU family DNA-binding protein, partial [Planctomycetota bacterium]